MQKWKYLFLDSAWDYSCGYIPLSQNSQRLKFSETVCTDAYINQLGDVGRELIYVKEKEEGNYMKMIFKRSKE